MSDLIERLQKSMCDPNMGCGTQPMCLCAVVDEAITRIEELERQRDEALKEMQRVAQIEYKGDRIREMISTKSRIQEMKDDN
jgi:hypothetical protein